MPKLLTRVQAAEYLGVSASTLARWAMNGVGPSYAKLGNQVRYSVSVLDDFISNCTVATSGGRE